MPGQNPTFVQGGPRTYEVSEAVKGGQVVERSTVPSTSGEPVCKVGTANSLTVYGVAFKDALPVTLTQADTYGTTAYAGGGFPTVDMSVIDEFTAVYCNVFIPVVYTAACSERQYIKAGAAGAVAPWVHGTDVEETKIGWCAQQGGVAVAGKALAWISV